MTMGNTSASARDEAHETVPVLIVGGGVVGLSTALFLAAQGVSSLLVERHPDLLSHPRARGFNWRTVEAFRQLGMEPSILAASYGSSATGEWHAVQADTLASDDYIDLVDEEEDATAYEELTPSPLAMIDQDQLEILVRRRASELGARLQYSTELVGCEQDETGVTATLQDRQTGATCTVRAEYLVAADGARSPLREQLGIPVDGPGPFFETMTIMIDADLRPALRGRRVDIAYLQQPSPGTIFLAHDQEGKQWVFGSGYSAERDGPLSDFTDERCAAMVRTAAGLPDVAVTLRPQIPGTEIKVMAFPIGAQVARNYQTGRIFLAGDAAHMVPPTGGLGANTGIQDAHNLAWKLAMVLRGQAGPDLLATYQAERHPVGLLTMQQAMARWEHRVETEESSLLPTATVVFGYRYRSSAVLGNPDGEQPVLDSKDLHGQAGTRAPHAWLQHDGETISTIDLFGREFVLLTGTAGDTWIDAASDAADRLGIDLTAYLIGPDGGLTDVQGGWPQAYRMGADGAILVRPDGVVAWRAKAAAADAAQELTRALESILSR